jgi:hypothetical protein
LGLFCFFISFVCIINQFMKTTILLPAALLAVLFFSCGPAAEDREKMHKRAKEFQDSIANTIRQSMLEAESPPQNIVVTPNATAMPQPSPALAPPAK